MTPAVKTSPARHRPAPAAQAPTAMRLAPSTTQITPTAITNHRNTSSTLVRNDDDRCTISNDFAHGLAHFRGIEAHHDDGVGTHDGRVAHHPIDRLPASLLQQLRIFVNLAAGDRAQSGHDVAADAAAPHHDSKALSDGFLHTMPRNMFGGR